MVVVNTSGKTLKIKELKRVVPADGKQYILPYKIAIRYKDSLKPIQLSDEPPKISPKIQTPPKTDKPETKELETESAEIKAESKPETKAESKPETKAEIKTESKSESKLELQETNDKREAVINIFKEGTVKSKKEIANITGVPYGSVLYYIKEYEKTKNTI